VPQFAETRKARPVQKSGSEIALFSESMVGMKTYYKPTQGNGKRVWYVSTDPAERKKQTVIGWVAISIFILGMGVIAWLIR
jgi:hypothetical protein